MLPAARFGAPAMIDVIEAYPPLTQRIVLRPLYRSLVQVDPKHIHTFRYQ